MCSSLQLGHTFLYLLPEEDDVESKILLEMMRFSHQIEKFPKSEHTRGQKEKGSGVVPPYPDERFRPAPDSIS